MTCGHTRQDTAVDLGLQARQQLLNADELVIDVDTKPLDDVAGRDARAVHGALEPIKAAIVLMWPC